VVYGVGGLNEGAVVVVPGLNLGGGAPTFPVRGYPADAILGRTAATAAAELRLPLALVGRGLGLLPLYLDRLSVTVFGDVGASWNPRGFAAGLPPSSSIASGGIELVTDLGVSYRMPLRLRVGAAWPLTGGRAVSAYVAFGPSF
jgi:hemolysin activation/secretion protein